MESGLPRHRNAIGGLRELVEEPRTVFIRWDVRDKGTSVNGRSQSPIPDRAPRVRDYPGIFVPQLSRGRNERDILTLSTRRTETRRVDFDLQDLTVSRYFVGSFCMVPFPKSNSPSHSG